jgi:ABC-type polysaccharide/polyol phosphate transport system ATPase subunit
VGVRDVSKTFRLPHQRYSTLKERVLHPFASSAYDELPALRDVSFSVQKGEFFGIVGRNGSGKSTLLKCLAGIYGIDQGEIDVHGRLSPFIELGVGFNPDLTARDNVLINAVMLGLSRKEARRRFDEIIAFAELEDFVDLKLKNYSSGMSVRLGFSVAVQADADVLLVDEVLAVGDAAFQRKCFDEFERMRSEERTILFVTHDMGAVERFCDRAMLLEGGGLLEMGPPDEIARRYGEVNFGSQGAPDAATGLELGVHARIRSLWCEGPSGERAVSLPRGERCRAHLEVEFLEPVTNPHFSLVFRNEVRHTIFVATTITHGPTGEFAPGDKATVTLSFPNWLAPSRYTITPVIAVWDPHERILDRKEDLVSLIAESEVYSGGVTDIPTELELVRG